MKTYIDCGFHLGEGAMKHIEKWNIKPSDQVIGIEANPYTYNYLLDTISKKNLSNSPYDFLQSENFQIINAVVWTKNGTQNFFCSKLTLSQDMFENAEFHDFIQGHDEKGKSGLFLTKHQGTGLPIDGSSTIFCKRNKKFLSKNGNATQKSLDFKNRIKVKSINFAEFLNNFPQNDDIVVKMDIEGAEFRVLRHLIKTGAISRISAIDVEWHDFGNFRLRILKKYLKYRIRKLGILIEEWE